MRWPTYAFGNAVSGQDQILGCEASVGHGGRIQPVGEFKPFGSFLFT